MRKPIGYIQWLFLSLAVASPALTATALEVRNQQGIEYVTGGIGVRERETLSAMAKDFNLKLRFALTSGPYLSAIQVSIQNEEGATVFEGSSDGPWFLLNLQPGAYTVLASDVNETLQQQVNIPQNNSRELVFRFQGQ